MQEGGLEQPAALPRGKTSGRGHVFQATGKVVGSQSALRGVRCVRCGPKQPETDSPRPRRALPSRTPEIQRLYLRMRRSTSGGGVGAGRLEGSPARMF